MNMIRDRPTSRSSSDAAGPCHVQAMPYSVGPSISDDGVGTGTHPICAWARTRDSSASRAAATSSCLIASAKKGGKNAAEVRKEPSAFAPSGHRVTRPDRL